MRVFEKFEVRPGEPKLTAEERAEYEHAHRVWLAQKSDAEQAIIRTAMAWAYAGSTNTLDLPSDDDVRRLDTLATACHDLWQVLENGK